MIEGLGSLTVSTVLLLGSPGPATLTLAAVGATSGIRGGLPFLVGILLGLVVCIVTAAFGIAFVFESYPGAVVTVQLLGAVYLLWIAYKIGSAPVLGEKSEASSSRPAVKDGFVLNLLNPKAYAAFAALFSQFLIPTKSSALSFVVTGVACFGLVVIIDFLWLAAGTAIRSLFSHERYNRPVRVAFAILIIIATAIALGSIA